MKIFNSFEVSGILFRIILCPLFIIMCLGNSCKKDEDLIQATVVDGGREEVDGCGWLITIADKTYYPTNLSVQYQKSGQKVLIKYSLLNENKVCGFPSSGVINPKIEVLKIRNSK